MQLQNVGLNTYNEQNSIDLWNIYISAFGEKKHNLNMRLLKKKKKCPQ